MTDELGMGHRLLDRLSGQDHELQKLDIPTLKKAAQRAGDHKLAAAMDEAIVDHLGNVMIRETALKFARREFYKAADDARISAPWANPGTSAAAPRRSGPAPRRPENATVMGQDEGNGQPTPTPVSTSAQGGVHNPEFALRLLQAIIDNQRRAMRQQR